MPRTHTHRHYSTLQVAFHWLSFTLLAVIVISATAYGFFLSLQPNATVFNSAPEESLALIGVAMSNNIGTDVPRADSIPVELPQDVDPVQAGIMGNAQTDWNFFEEHFKRLSEMDELLNINIVEYLNTHDDREIYLERYLSALEIKTVESKEAFAILTQKLAMYQNSIPAVQGEIRAKQASIETSYNSRNVQGIQQGVIDLEELHVLEKEYAHKIAFYGKIASEYSARIGVAEQKITILRANSEALIKWVTINLPQGANLDSLRELHLFNSATN